MTISRQEPTETKSGVSISDMARAVGLSRQRFHQLMKAGVFPQPLHDEATGRPYYDESSQAQCLEVRRRNCGVNGKIILFYARRPTITTPTPRPMKPRPAPVEQHAEVIDGVRALGLAHVTAAQVGETISLLFKCGIAGVDVGEIIRVVFLHLRKNTADKVG
jgi:hypothetical protein